MSEFYFDPPGFKRGAEVLNCADYLGLIVKGGGGNYTIKDQKLRGYDSAVKFLEDNVAVRKSLESEILSRSEELFKNKGEENVDLLA